LAPRWAWPWSAASISPPDRTIRAPALAALAVIAALQVLCMGVAWRLPHKLFD
jgi:hypothetical protein